MFNFTNNNRSRKRKKINNKNNSSKKSSASKVEYEETFNDIILNDLVPEEKKHEFGLKESTSTKKSGAFNLGLKKKTNKNKQSNNTNKQSNGVTNNNHKVNKNNKNNSAILPDIKEDILSTEKSKPKSKKTKVKRKKSVNDKKDDLNIKVYDSLEDKKEVIDE